MRIIKVLTNKDAKHFNKEAPKYEVVIAGFFMVNCPACDDFKPEWNNFVKSCEHKDEPRVLIAEVDSNHASNVDFDTSALEGFPTVYRDVKSDHGVEEFKKERTVKALHHFLKEAIAAKKKAHKKTHMHGGKRRKTRKKKKRKRRKKRKTKKRKSRKKRGGGGDVSRVNYFLSGLHPFQQSILTMKGMNDYHFPPYVINFIKNNWIRVSDKEEGIYVTPDNPEVVERARRQKWGVVEKEKLVEEKEGNNLIFSPI